MYGYLDESGSPGKATRDKDYLLLCLIFFANKKLRDDAEAKIKKFRKNIGLVDDFEFHSSRNSVKIQNAFFSFLSKLDFKIISVIIQKDELTKTASYERISSMLISEI